MKRLRNAAIFVGVVLALKGPVLAAESKDYAFFPWDKGTRWVYDTTNKKKSEHFEMNVVIEGPWDEDDLSGMIMTQKDERGKMRQFLLKTDKAILAHKLALSKSYTPEVTTRFTPSLPIFIFPLTPGTTVHWEGRLKVTGIVNKPIVLDAIVKGFDDIQVPAGKYHCVKLHLHQKRGEDIIDEDVWYAEGVGQVKYDGGQYVKELKEFKKP